MVITWPEGYEDGNYHDASCTCSRHCGYCLEDLDKLAAIRDQLIAEGRLPGQHGITQRHRYCSPHCQRQAKRERALDRALAAIAITKES